MAASFKVFLVPVTAGLQELHDRLAGLLRELGCQAIYPIGDRRGPVAPDPDDRFLSGVLGRCQGVIQLVDLEEPPGHLAAEGEREEMAVRIARCLRGGHPALRPFMITFLVARGAPAGPPSGEMAARVAERQRWHDQLFRGVGTLITGKDAEGICKTVKAAISSLSSGGGDEASEEASEVSPPDAWDSFSTVREPPPSQETADPEMWNATFNPPTPRQGGAADPVPPRVEVSVPKMDPEVVSTRGQAVAGPGPVEPGPGPGPEESLPEWPDAGPQYPPENVQFTVFRPRQIHREEWRKLLVYAHLEDGPLERRSPLEAVRQEAARILGPRAAEYQDQTKDSRLAIPREKDITLVPAVPGVRFNPPSRMFTWVEGIDWHQEEFQVRADSSLPDAPVAGKLTVYLGVLILAEIPLRFQVSSQAAPAHAPTGALVAAETAGAYRNIFPSYSHKDTEIVEQIEAYAATLGDHYLRDATTLRAGQDWNAGLQNSIRQAHVFQLFWSSHSARSPEVEKEWRYALSLGRSEFIRPTYWEDPIPKLPPEINPTHCQKLRVTLPAEPASASRAAPAIVVARQRPPVVAPPPPFDPEVEPRRPEPPPRQEAPPVEHRAPPSKVENSDPWAHYAPPSRSENRDPWGHGDAPYVNVRSSRGSLGKWVLLLAAAAVMLPGGFVTYRLITQPAPIAREKEIEADPPPGGQPLPPKVEEPIIAKDDEVKPSSAPPELAPRLQAPPPAPAPAPAPDAAPNIAMPTSPRDPGPLVPPKVAYDPGPVGPAPPPQIEGPPPVLAPKTVRPPPVPAPEIPKKNPAVDRGKKTVESPPSARGGTYLVMPGDTLSEIARKHGVSLKSLQSANKISNPKSLQAGRKLVIPLK